MLFPRGPSRRAHWKLPWEKKKKKRKSTKVQLPSLGFCFLNTSPSAAQSDQMIQKRELAPSAPFVTSPWDAGLILRPGDGFQSHQAKATTRSCETECTSPSDGRRGPGATPQFSFALRCQGWAESGDGVCRGETPGGSRGARPGGG